MPELLTEAQSLSEFENNPGVGTAFAEWLDHGRTILQMGLAARPVLECRCDVRHFEKARCGQHVIAKLGGRGHEKIGGDAKLDGFHSVTATHGVGVGHDGVRAEIQQRFYRVGPLLQYRIENIVCRAIPWFGRRPQRLSFAPDAERAGFFR